MRLNRHDKPMQLMLARRKSVRGIVEDSVLHARAVVKAFDEVLMSPLPPMKFSAITANETQRSLVRRVRKIEAEIARLEALRSEAEDSYRECRKLAVEFRAKSTLASGGSREELEIYAGRYEADAAQWQMTIDELRALQQDASQSLAALESKVV